MKKALMDFTGGVADIVEPGEEYPLFLGRGCAQMWVNAPDNITKTWTLEWSPSAEDMIWVERTKLTLILLLLVELHMVRLVSN